MAPFRLKCACKFRIVCNELTGKMHPLPNCATGEWGPTKERRHFGLVPLSHTSGLINVETVVELRLRQPRPLQFVFRLRFNDVDDSQLKPSVRRMRDRVKLNINNYYQWRSGTFGSSRRWSNSPPCRLTFWKMELKLKLSRNVNNNISILVRGYLCWYSGFVFECKYSAH